ncbi:hypothetical protein C7M84_014808 [Penaeus vannamei]|uniref:Uncharacterized protein n=1 Tax=Penaeus vannamei TaxID=6689 RepID=A0A423SSD6_PENVA|nr:hypothetical protein C7M84_014808 [Penaeus vannamei]
MAGSQTDMGVRRCTWRAYLPSSSWGMPCPGCPTCPPSCSRAFSWVGHPSSTETGYSLVMETCEPRLRSIIGIIVYLPWCFSLITLGGFGYLLRDWRWLMFTVSMPGLLYLPVLWLMDESPRWLIVRGRHADALRVLRKALTLE